MFGKRIFKALQEHQVRYVVVGGVAVNLHGYSRTTMDLDILIDFDKDNVAALIAATKALGLKPRVPVMLSDLADVDKRAQWVREKNMVALLLENPHDPLEQLDVLIKEDADFDQVYAQCVKVELEDCAISLVDINDLIAMKEMAARQRDQLDVQALKKIKEINGGE